MPETFIISDQHYGHANALTFKKSDGSPLRDFSSAEEMNEHMIHCHNSVVRPQDKVIFLGDVAINKKYLEILRRLNGKKKLIMGNHDIFELKYYAEHFYEMKAYRVFDKHIMSHIPVHKASIGRFVANVHGHTHSENVLLEDGTVDPHYIAMCVEQPHVNYTPVPWYRVKEILKDRGIYDC